MSHENDAEVPPKGEADRVYGWWLETRNDRAAMARLRRCHNPLDALLVPATLSLLRRLPGRQEDRAATGVAALAAVLGHVREHDHECRIARAIGRSSFNEDETAKLSEGRFRRLMQNEGSADLQRAMTRLMHFMGQRADVRDLADTMLFWGERTKRRWAFDYYAVRIAAPEAPSLPEAPGDSDSTSIPSA